MLMIVEVHNYTFDWLRLICKKKPRKQPHLSVDAKKL